VGRRPIAGGCAIEVHRVLGPGLLSGIKQGFLINFNVELLKDGLRSFVL
jgi:hypothetical protein